MSSIFIEKAQGSQKEMKTKFSHILKQNTLPPYLQQVPISLLIIEKSSLFFFFLDILQLKTSSLSFYY